MDWCSKWFEFGDAAYLNTAWQGAMPRTSIEAAQMAIQWKKYPFLIPETVYSDLPARSRSLLARLIHAEESEIAITTGASGGLAVVASAMEFEPQDEVLLAEGDFAAHLATWAPLARAGRLRLVMVKARRRYITAEDILDVLGPTTRLVSVSLVQPYDGALLNAATLSHACHSVGAFLLLDVTQCAGAMPLDVRTLGADFVVSAGYKWLLGPYGTGFFWVRSSLKPQLRCAPVNWKAVERIVGPDIEITENASRWDAPETANFFNLPALSNSIEFLLNTGPETVWTHNRCFLTEVLRRLPLDRCRLASPADPEDRGPFVCMCGNSATETELIHKKLLANGIYVSFRNNAIRVAPHLFSTERDIDRLLSTLAS